MVVWSGTYDSFGNCTVNIEGITNNLRLPGQYYDTETGLHYNLNRYYDPQTGRYLNTDPFGDGLNLYTYCFNNPINLMDPNGLCAAKTAWDTGREVLEFALYHATGGPARDAFKDLMYAYGSDWMIEGYEGIVSGRYFGTGYGEDSAQQFVKQYDATGNLLYGLGGLLASLWTPDTWQATATTLATAGMGAEGSIGNVPANSRYFWSQGTMERATSAALNEGGKTIAMTTEGKMVSAIESVLPEKFSKISNYLWDDLSAYWAAGVKDTANAFIGNWKATTTWARIEFPRLVQKSVNIIYR